MIASLHLASKCEHAHIQLTHSRTYTAYQAHKAGYIDFWVDCRCSLLCASRRKVLQPHADNKPGGPRGQELRAAARRGTPRAREFFCPTFLCQHSFALAPTSMLAPNATCLRFVFTLRVVILAHARPFPSWRFLPEETIQAGGQREEVGKGTGAKAGVRQIPPQASTAQQAPSDGKATAGAPSDVKATAGERWRECCTCACTRSMRAAEVVRQVDNRCFAVRYRQGMKQKEGAGRGRSEGGEGGHRERGRDIDHIFPCIVN